MGNKINGPKHTRYTIMAKLDPSSTLRTRPMTDTPSKDRDYTKDSIAVTVVCYREGKNSGEIEFLAIKYENGRGITFRFPTETGEQNLKETSEMVARACLYQEVIVSDNGHVPEIGITVLENVRPSDPSSRPRQQTPETISAPEWYEASNLMDKMFSRGIRSHRQSLVAALSKLAAGNKNVASFYMNQLNQWANDVAD